MSERRILIMDDDQDVRFIIACVLKKLGFEAEGAANGDEALAMYETALASLSPYAAVILDLNIPGRMGGVETARQLLALDPAALLYVSSGDEYDPVMLHCRDYGFTGSLSKPFTYADAVAVFKHILPAKKSTPSPAE